MFSQCRANKRNSKKEPSKIYSRAVRYALDLGADFLHSHDQTQSFDLVVKGLILWLHGPKVMKDELAKNAIFTWNKQKSSHRCAEAKKYKEAATRNQKGRAFRDWLYVVAQEGEVSKELMATQPPYPASLPCPLPQHPQFSPPEAREYLDGLRSQFVVDPEEEEEEECDVAWTPAFDERRECGTPEAEEEVVWVDTGKEVEDMLLEFVAELMKRGLSEAEAIERADKAIMNQLEFMGMSDLVIDVQ